MAEVSITKSNKKVKQLEEKIKQFEKEEVEAYDENERLKKENERLKAAVKAHLARGELISSVTMEEFERLKKENERLKGVEAELKKMTADWVERCDVLEQVKEDRRAAEEEKKILEEQLEEQEAELEALRAGADGALRAELEETKAELEETKEQLEALTAKPVKKRRVKRGALTYNKECNWALKLNEEQLEFMNEVYNDEYEIEWSQINRKKYGSKAKEVYEAFKGETTATASKKKGMWNDEIVKAYVLNTIRITRDGQEVEPFKAWEEDFE